MLKATTDLAFLCVAFLPSVGDFSRKHNA